jgi:hypothetical protein
MIELKNLAKYKRYLLPEANLLVVKGSVAPVITGMGVYNSRHQIAPPNNELNPLIQELLAATALSAVSLAERESWGWTLAFAGVHFGYFVGVEPEGMICVRIFDAEAGRASGLIQRQKSGLPMTQSHIAPRTQSPRDVVEQYFSEVDQIKTRLAIREDGEGVLVQALPGGNFDIVKELGTEELLRNIDNAIRTGSVKELGEVLFFYECRCSEEMIFGMVANMKDADRRDLFGDLQQLEIECPRCSRKFMVPRTDQGPH